jgi:transcriptional antiterminator Rof (Rho-off)
VRGSCGKRSKNWFHAAISIRHLNVELRRNINIHGEERILRLDTLASLGLGRIGKVSVGSAR